MVVVAAVVFSVVAAVVVFSVVFAVVSAGLVVAAVVAAFVVVAFVAEVVVTGFCVVVTAVVLLSLSAAVVSGGIVVLSSENSVSSDCKAVVFWGIGRAVSAVLAPVSKAIPPKLPFETVLSGISLTSRLLQEQSITAAARSREAICFICKGLIFIMNPFRISKNNAHKYTSYIITSELLQVNRISNILFIFGKNMKICSGITIQYAHIRASAYCFFLDKSTYL